MVIRTEEEIREKRDFLVKNRQGHYGNDIMVLDWVLKESPRDVEEKKGLVRGEISNPIKLTQYKDKSWKELIKILGPREAKKVMDAIKNEKT